MTLTKNNPTISIEELAKESGLTRYGINYNIKKLKKKNIIKRIEPNNGGHWDIII